MNELNIIIAGSRNFDDYELLKYEVTRIIKEAGDAEKHIRIISGGARGADRLGEQFASEFGYDIERFPADWDRYGKQAGFLRNVEMAEAAVQGGNDGRLIAFWDGMSRGTRHMIDTALKYGLTIHIIHFEKD